MAIIHLCEFYAVAYSALVHVCCSPQQGDVIVRIIEISGNKQTKDKIIFRELSFNPGSVIPAGQVEILMEDNRNYLLNTGLFSSVSIRTLPSMASASEIDVSISLIENWYLFPAPIISLAGRSISSVFTDGTSIKKVNLGAKLYHLNLSGQNDYFKASAQAGYTQKIQLKYRLPYFNERQTWGIEAEVSFSKDKEVAYNTVSNHLVYLETSRNNVFQKLFSDLTFTHRRQKTQLPFYGSFLSAIRRRGFSTGFESEVFHKHLHGTTIFFLSLHRFIQDKRDRIPVSTTGHRFLLLFRKEGLGISRGVNLATLELEYQKYLSFSDRLSAYIIPKARVHCTRNATPYYFNTALGYGENQIRGYESYVIDGMDYVYAKSGVQYKLFEMAVDLGKAVPFDKLRRIPLHVYLGFNIDSGLVHDPSFGDLNGFDSELLVGFGPSVQFLFFEHFLLSVDYNFNHLSESGLYLHGGFNL